MDRRPATCEALFATGPVPPPPQGPLSFKDACSRVYPGPLAEGAPCTSTAECAPGAKGWAYCNPSLGYLVDAGAGTGVCQPVEEVVGTCGDSAHSPTDPSIKPFAVCPTGPCDNGFCHPVSEAGGTCKQFSGYVCGPELKCAMDVCAALPAAGQPCPDGVCASAVYCDQASKTCMARKASGATCLGDECAAPMQCTGGKCAVAAGTMCTMGH